MICQLIRLLSKFNAQTFALQSTKKKGILRLRRESHYKTHKQQQDKLLKSFLGPTFQRQGQPITYLDLKLTNM